MIYEFKVIAPLPDPELTEKFPVGTIVEVNMKMSEYDGFVNNNPELERYIGTAPAVTFEGRTYGGGYGLETKQPDGFKEVLAKIGEAHPISPLAERYRKNKTIKEIKTKEVVKKHREKAVSARKEAIKKVRNKVNS
jgi:hypothetical protein